MQLHLIRHPRPAVAPGICYGQTDLGLAEPTAEVAARLRPLLPERYTLHASPLQRARLLAEQLGAPRLDERLREMHFGAWEGVAFDTLGRAIDAWAADPLGFRAPGGESAREMAARVLHWLDEVLGAARGGGEAGANTWAGAAAGNASNAAGTQEAAAPALVVVAHGGPLRAIAGHLLGLPPERWLALDFGCGQVTRLDVESWGVVLRWFNR